MSTSEQVFDYKDFFVISPELIRGGVHLKLLSEIDDTWGILKNEISVTSPLEFIVQSGTRLTDLLSTDTAVLDLVSDKLVILLEANRITGWATFPVSVRDKEGNMINGYRGLVITGKGGKQIHELSNKVWKLPISPKGQGREANMGLYFDPTKWDGSDMFTLDDLALTIVKASVKTILRDNKITNIRVKSISEIEVETTPTP